MRALRQIWSSTEFDAENIARFAQPEIRVEAQRGVFALGALTMLLMLGLAALYYSTGLGKDYVYTFFLLALLAAHIAVSARVLADTKVLYLLGMVLLSLCGLAFVLLAHRHGIFSPSMFSTVVLLFLVVPLVPWGVREALVAVGILYVMFTASTFSVANRFPPQSLWTLQFLMVSSGAIALTLVAREILVRKAHLQARFSLTSSNAELQRLSHQDALTGAWNRRFLEETFEPFAARARESGTDYCLAVVDLDDFKALNDVYGHTCGDRVLQWLVKVLSGALRGGEYLVRMGGDEFVLLLNGSDSRERLEHVLRTLNAETHQAPSPIPQVGASVGLARVHAGVKAQLHPLYMVADKALYSAKARPSASLVELDFAGTLQ